MKNIRNLVENLYLLAIVMGHPQLVIQAHLAILQSPITVPSTKRACKYLLQLIDSACIELF